MSYEQNYKYNNNYNKEEYIKQKNKKRDATYRKIYLSASYAMKSGDVFQQYLDVQSRFSDYSVGNALLISLQMPEATLFKDKENWKKSGINVKNNQKGFDILEPSHAKSKPNEVKALFYNPKEVFDISQTDSKPSDKAKIYSDKDLLKAFITNCPVKIETVDELNDSTLGAQYNKEDNKLYICRGLETNIMFQTISSELARIAMEYKEDNNLSDFECYCISYMICKKYGIDVSNYKFEVLPNEIKQMGVKEFRKELEYIRDGMLNVNSRINENLEKNPKEKQYER